MEPLLRPVGRSGSGPRSSGYPAKMRKPLVLAATSLLVALLSGCGSASNPEPAPPAKPSATRSADAGATIIKPGQLGPFAVGTTSQELLAAGLVEEPPEGECPTLRPVAEFKDLGLQFDHSKADKPLTGVLLKGRGLSTAEGIQVGDSISKLKTTYGSELDAQTGEYGETVYVLNDGKMAMGFSAEDDKIFAIEVFAAGDLPVWDGC